MGEFVKRTAKYSKKCPVCNADATEQELTDTEFNGREIDEYYNCNHCSVSYVKHFEYVETEVVD